MKKTYTITIETKADGTMPDEECIREAVLAYHRTSIAEITVADTTKAEPKKKADGRWNLQELGIVDLGLSNLQIVQLNELGSQISDGQETYQSVVGSLTNEEAVYLFAWLENEGIDVSKEG